MDKTTLLGLVAGIAIIFSAIAMGSAPGEFLYAPALLIVFGGTLASTMIKFPFNHVMNSFRVAGRAFTRSEEDPKTLILQVKDLAKTARMKGLLALEDADVGNPFFRKGLQLCADGVDPELMHKVLKEDLELSVERHEVGQRIFRAIGESAPAFGMIGTLVGLVQMLAHLDDPAAIGPGMATALLTTLYGAMFAQLVALPIADKLELRAQNERANKMLILEGINCIRQGFNARMIEDLLSAYLPTKARGELAEMEEARASEQQSQESA
ncbi:chemotaxis protein MotA [Alkalispirillum mobile]|uniref:Chemotaxis protein MotA n=1 Tax=Alkalispirillum mobile TaxID=85925 RepID=A0A498C544_9GAMM|nr:MotA/TolQ/ExbB proton channel family protein [Alkalispirillum mobile]RLK50353.1 chemotaxis protein MotA [Alkalispirillum mobile]